ncbi:S10 family peptidase [Sphingomonas segetis]|jgi:carboxypeptidase C (cathepsin A)|uniref:S10 family peptidase n=1 Tax=Sphingomonas segetis TaxID=1104779 RepID=UPI0012D2BCFF|nr:peptidase S10 [Sphingomonas segetis]
MRFLPILSAAALFAASSALAQSGSDKAKTPEALHSEQLAKEASEAWADAPVEERTVSTHHSIDVAGRALKYTATAGTLTIRDTTGKPQASIFYTADTLDGVPGSRRPVTFFYNGGPGSASLWLRMGSFGPMRIQTGSPEYIRPAPFDFGPNPDTLLGTTDLVFIDAPGTGYSRPLGDAKGSDFYGVDQDADAFARAIMRYITRFERWDSPKFLFGESYGTTRSGALAYQLQDRGVALNGVMLLSSIMNYGRRQPGLDRDYLNYLPSYAATAWYHHKMANPPATVEEAVAQARAFAQGPYASALEKGQTISAEERAAVARQMSALTGLSPDFIERANLRVDLSRFRKELLRDERLTVGRFDSRYTGVDPDAAGDSPDFDASDVAISGAFVGTMQSYMARDLGYRTDMPYRLSASEQDGFKWDWTHRAPGFRYSMNTPNTALDLSAAMRTNPYLKVLSLNGWYDMATPFFGTEYDLNHMMLEPAQQHNLEYRYYPSGHMIYLNPDSLHRMRLDVEAFINGAIADARSAPPPARRRAR